MRKKPLTLPPTDTQNHGGEAAVAAAAAGACQSNNINSLLTRNGIYIKHTFHGKIVVVRKWKKEKTKNIF